MANTVKLTPEQMQELVALTKDAVLAELQPSSPHAPMTYDFARIEHEMNQRVQAKIDGLAQMMSGGKARKTDISDS